MFNAVITFEAKKLLIKRNVVIFVVIFLILAAFSREGINDYKTILDNRKPFLETEKGKVSQFLNYTQYGTRGLRLLLIPGPLSVIFNDLAVYSGLVANVDTGDGLNIYNTFKGKDLFAGPGGFMDFSGFILLISCFLAMIYGYDVTQNPGYLKLLAGISGDGRIPLLIILARVILLNLVFLLLSGLSLLWLLFNGINAVNVYFACFVLVLVLVVTIFLLAGGLIGSLKKRPVKWITLTGVYFFLLFLLPWLIQKAVYIEAGENIESNYKMEYKKLKVILEFEKRVQEQFGVWKSGNVAPEEIKAAVRKSQQAEYKKFREYENKRINQIDKRIKIHQAVSAISPTTFYLSVNKELSSKGFQNFIHFYRFALDTKHRFIEFYIEKKFYNPLPKTGVEPFGKEKENVFNAESQLPPSFWPGVGLMFAYIAGLLLISRNILVKVPEPSVKKPGIQFPKNRNSVFVLCRDEQLKTDICRYYGGQKNASCLEKITPDQFRFDKGPAETLDYFCRIAGIAPEKAVEHLVEMGVTNPKELKNHSRESILKIYTAVKTAADNEFIILNDFVKRESRSFETDLLRLIAALEKNGKKIIYLSTEMYYPVESINGMINVKYFQTFPLMTDEVTLR